MLYYVFQSSWADIACLKMRRRLSQIGRLIFGVAHQIQDDLDDMLENNSEYIPPSNIYWFLEGEGTPGTLEESISIACRLAESYVTKGIGKLSFSSVPVCLQEDLRFISQWFGNRKAAPCFI